MLKKFIFSFTSYLSYLTIGFSICCIRMYRYSLGLLLGNCCRFYPSCSNYAEQAIKEFGIIRGLYLTTLRILRCHPYHPGGYDPIPKSREL